MCSLIKGLLSEAHESCMFAADDHDVLHFLTTSLHPPGQAPTLAGGLHVSEEEQHKLSQEYADYQRKLEQQKEE
jgi:mannose-binding lectin 1